MVMSGRGCITRHKLMQFRLQDGCCNGSVAASMPEMVVVTESPIDLVMPTMLVVTVTVTVVVHAVAKGPGRDCV